MHIHLDPTGGIAGDMFVAALLDTWPELSDRVIATVRLAGLRDDINIERVVFNDGVLTGSKFKVALHKDEATATQKHLASPGDHNQEHNHDHEHEQGGHGRHKHQQWSELLQQLTHSALPDGVKRHALGIFGELAIAEAKVHGTDVDSVTFHEVGNWDSIADIVATATLIDTLAAQSWSVSALPIGRGLVNTAHGELPVPAPATTLLLDGFAFRDDGRHGERVTPTGAAILKYLAPATSIGQSARTLCKSGFGFGNRRLPGMSNVLRVMAFNQEGHNSLMAGEHTGNPTIDYIGVIQFEVDDQTGEELAATLKHIRKHDEVLDATQSTVFGKKGRMMAAIQVLTNADSIDAVARLCFQQSTTLGLRTRIETRQILQRHEMMVGATRVKLAERPGGVSAKAEMDDVLDDASGHHVRLHTRLEAQTRAIQTRAIQTSTVQEDGITSTKDTSPAEEIAQGTTKHRE